MSKGSSFIVGAVVGVALTAIVAYRSYDVMDAELEELRARDAVMTQALAERDKVSAEMVAKYEARIAILNGEIDSANTVIAANGEEDKKKAARIKDLEAAYAEAGSCEERLQSALAQRDEWKSRFTLSVETIGRKDGIIFSVNQKYEVARKELIIKDSQIAKRDELLLARLGRINSLENILSSREKWGKVKTAVALGGAAYIALDVLLSALR